MTWEALTYTVRRVRHFGSKRFCPACQSYSRRFREYGSPPRPDARCPICSSSERERAQALLLRRRLLPLLGTSDGLRVLHIAPEAGIGQILRKAAGAGYISGDVEPGRAMRVVDLTALTFPSESFDLFFASHVLEHIVDDALALSEIHRVLKPSGVAYIEVPVLCKETYEDPTITSFDERLAKYGQGDHVRLCGLDYEERLKKAGFETQAVWVEQEFGDAEFARMRLQIELPEDVKERMPPGYEQHYSVGWICRKVAAPSPAAAPARG